MFNKAVTRDSPDGINDDPEDSGTSPTASARAPSPARQLRRRLRRLRRNRRYLKTTAGERGQLRNDGIGSLPCVHGDGSGVVRVGTYRMRGAGTREGSSGP